MNRTGDNSDINTVDTSRKYLAVDVPDPIRPRGDCGDRDGDGAVDVLEIDRVGGGEEVGVVGDRRRHHHHPQERDAGQIAGLDRDTV